jgi:hypothetical protein
MKVEVTRHRKPDGYATRYWSVVVNGELLAVTLYRKGALAVARALNHSNPYPHVTFLEDSPNPAATSHQPAAGVASYRTR